MAAALEALLGDMPHLNAEHAELRAFLDEVQELARLQEELKGQLQQMTRLRRESERRGQDLRSRVAAQLRGKLGFKNETLLRFGVPPRRARTRRTPDEPAKPPIEVSAGTGETSATAK
jgi:hypothetical protein